MERVDHPAHYGGDTVKYICRAGKKPTTRIEITTQETTLATKFLLDNRAALEDLRKAAWYLNREIERLSSTTDTSRS